MKANNFKYYIENNIKDVLESDSFASEAQMVHINHVEISVHNLYEAAVRLRDETGFGFYDGGWSEAGTGSKITPLGEGAYLQIASLVDAFALKDARGAASQKFMERAAAGDRFGNLNLRVDSSAELERIGKIYGMTLNTNSKAGRIRPDGDRVGAIGLTGGKGLPAGMPSVYYFPDMSTHPSGHPVEPAYGLVKPLGIAWVEVGGDKADYGAWLGSDPSSLPLRFNRKAPGVYALGVRTAGGEVVIRRLAMNS